MSSEEPCLTIQLRKVDGGWAVRDEETGLTAEGETKEAAVEALEQAVESTESRPDLGSTDDGRYGPNAGPDGPDVWSPAY